MRRAALALIVFFMAGPATNWHCVWSCWATPASPAHVATAERCHPADTGGATTLTSGAPCNPEVQVSPFVKSTIATAPAFVAGVEAAPPLRTVLSIDPGPLVHHHTGPPGTRTVIPLRI